MSSRQPLIASKVMILKALAAIKALMSYVTAIIIMNIVLIKCFSHMT